MKPESVYRHIGALIKSRRKQSEPPLTQEKLAQLLGISRASLANIETGRQSVLVHQLYDFAQALGVSPSDFLVPVNDTGARAEWSGLLPENLNPQQKEQIARLLADTRAEPSHTKEEIRAKQTKR
jgi:transcriptional regulator with XRE-family HTH domain